MSDITGTGHGNAHDWENCGTAPYKVTYYSCRKCGAKFEHRYDEEPEIFEAMKKSGVGAECCPDMPNVKLRGCALAQSRLNDGLGIG